MKNVVLEHFDFYIYLDKNHYKENFKCISIKSDI